MWKANYHTHTTRCKHAQDSDEDYVIKAIPKLALRKSASLIIVPGPLRMGMSPPCGWMLRNWKITFHR